LELPVPQFVHHRLVLQSQPLVVTDTLLHHELVIQRGREGEVELLRLAPRTVDVPVLELIHAEGHQVAEQLLVLKYLLDVAIHFVLLAEFLQDHHLDVFLQVGLLRHAFQGELVLNLFLHGTHHHVKVQGEHVSLFEFEDETAGISEQSFFLRSQPRGMAQVEYFGVALQQQNNDPFLVVLLHIVLVKVDVGEVHQVLELNAQLNWIPHKEVESKQSKLGQKQMNSQRGNHHLVDCN